MARYKCEPLRAWDALEAFPRKVDFDRTLKAEVHDPLWMLTRQWQFGEFKGDDTGSAIFAKVSLKTQSVSHFKGANQANYVSFPENTPLETVVERLPIEFDLFTRIQVGQQFMRFLHREGQTHNNSTHSVPYVRTTLLDAFVQAFPLSLPEIGNNATNREKVEAAKYQSHTPAVQFVSAMNGVAFDGVFAYVHFKNNHAIPAGIDLDYHPFIHASVLSFLTWFENMYSIPTNAEDINWVDRHLEYSLSCRLPEEDGKQTELVAEEYYQGQLDWFAFDLQAKNNQAFTTNGQPKQQHYRPLNPINNAQDLSSLLGNRLYEIIPTEAQFGGMPNPRWWEFEDGAVNFTKINPNTKDVATILITEFALVYSNDWMMMPYKVPAGSLTKINGIVVTDVFGQKTVIEPAGKSDLDDWSRFNLFSLSSRVDNVYTKGIVDNRLFLPPAVHKIQESKPLEEVAFIRDEMANMVWAVEMRIADLLGASRDGLEASRELQAFLEELWNAGSFQPTENNSKLMYQLGNTVPENWIPFIARHKDDENRSIILQRASMPREFNEQYLPIRPRTNLLRAGLGSTMSANGSFHVSGQTDIQTHPYFVYEEEIPRAGIRVTGSFQRTRWYDGTTFLWYGRRKRTGRGEGQSGLAFDTVQDR
ncbi:MAG: hypothetical protein AAF598_03795 [Bacteroidota bacterium]